MNKFGTRSRAKLQTCHNDLQKIMFLAIDRSKVDFGISEGHRPVARQQMLYAIGRTIELHKEPITNVDGINDLSEHNYEPSKAADIFIYDPDDKMREKIIYSPVHLAYVAGIIDSCAQELFEQGKIKHLIRWGANWDSDGIIAEDQKLDDYPHFELVKP